MKAKKIYKKLIEALEPLFRIHHQDIHNEIETMKTLFIERTAHLESKIDSYESNLSPLYRPDFQLGESQFSHCPLCPWQRCITFRLEPTGLLSRQETRMHQPIEQESLDGLNEKENLKFMAEQSEEFSNMVASFIN